MQWRSLENSGGEDTELLSSKINIVQGHEKEKDIWEQGTKNPQVLLLFLCLSVHIQVIKITEISDFPILILLLLLMI